MIRISKLTILFLIVIGLLLMNIFPALAALSYPTAKPIAPVPPLVDPPAKPAVPSIPSTKPPVASAPAPVTRLTDEESKMLNLVNRERMGTHLKPLTINMQLVNLARQKSLDMVTNNYFGHTSPVYGSPFEMMKKAGVKYTTAGENIAGATSTESAQQKLMNSPGQRANILDPSFNQLGIGITQSNKYGNIFTQIFIGK
jgi:uncharacterized YkwD family protein